MDISGILALLDFENGRKANILKQEQNSRKAVFKNRGSKF